ncbi:MAG: hypothetical protein ACFFCQ_13975 [Promethearchaeota archaeon]
MLNYRNIPTYIYLTIIFIIISTSHNYLTPTLAQDPVCAWWDDIKVNNSFVWKILEYKMGNSSLEERFALGNIEPEKNQTVEIKISQLPPNKYRFSFYEPDHLNDPWFNLFIGTNISNENRDPFPLIIPQTITDPITKIGADYFSDALFSGIKHEGGEAWINGEPDDPQKPTWLDTLVNITFIYEGIRGEVHWEVEPGLLKYAKLIGSNTNIEIELLTDPLKNSTSSNLPSLTSNQNGIITGFHGTITFTLLLILLWIKRLLIRKKTLKTK